MGTTAEKLTYLNTTKQLIKESINLTDANITTQPFRQYATILKHRLPEIVGDPSIIWNNYEHVTGSGTSFSITAYNSIIDYSLKGNTTQNGTPTPTSPIPINVVSGDNIITIENSDSSESQSYHITLPEGTELCKIGDYQDYIYKDNGKWYLHKEIGKVVLNGTQNITLASSGTRRFNATYTKLGISNVKEGTSAEDTTLNYRKCDHFIYSAGQNTWGRYYLYDNWLVMFDSDSTIASTNDLKIWLENNNTSIYYVLATPTNTEITDVNLIYQLNGVSLITGLNNISVSGDLPATLDLTALKYE